MRSRDVWAEVAPAAGIRIEHRGMALAGGGPRRWPCWRRSWATEMGEGCELLTAGTRRPSAARCCAAGSARRCSGARTSCGSSRATRSRPCPLAGRGAWRHLPARDRGPRGRRRRRIETTRGRVTAERLHRLSRRRFPRPVPGPTRRLRPDALQAADAARRGRRRRRPLHGGGHVRPQPGALSGLCRTAGGRTAAAAARGASSRSTWPTACT